MKAVINEKETPVQKKKYPWIGIDKDTSDYTIILFTNKSTGVVLSSDYRFRYDGEFSDEFNEDKFTPFAGSITLSND